MAISIAISELFTRTSREETLKSDEQLLVKECIRESTLAQKVLYECYYEKMLGICLRYSGDQMMAEDMLHEGFMKVFGNLQKFSFESKLSTWIHRVFTNHCIDTLRKKKREKVLYSEEVLASYTEEPIHEEEIESIDCQKLIELMHHLPEGYKTVLMMYSVDGYTHEEIGEVLDISAVTSRSQLNRARKAFRKLLAERGVTNG